MNERFVVEFDTEKYYVFDTLNFKTVCDSSDEFWADKIAYLLNMEYKDN